MSSEEEGKRHPLLTDVVLETLVKVAQHNSIPNCRLVCKAWNYHFLPRFRKEFCVKLNEWRSVEKFVQLLENCKEIPYSRFHMSRVSMNDPWVEAVFELCGDVMAGLTLEMTKDDIDICQFREILLFRAPNLNELSFDTLEGLPEEVTNHCRLFPSWYNRTDHLQRRDLSLKTINLRFSSAKQFHSQFLTQLFQACPSLEEINFRRFVKGNNDSGTELFINAFAHTESWRSLNSLNLGQIENHCLVTLTHIDGLRLRKFSFEYLTADVRDETVESFLKSQSENLEELILNEYFGNNHLYVDFPAMSSLKKLCVTAFDKSQIVPRKPVCYVNDFPKLETLEVYGWQNTFPWDIYFSRQQNPAGLYSLRKLQPPYRINEVHYLQRLGQLFPAVIHADITSPSNDVLEQLWSTWSELEVLEVFLDWNNTNVDSAFTGLAPVEVESIRRGIRDPEEDFVHHPHKSIRNLKNLKRFICEIYEPWRDGEPEAEDPTCLLTDVSGYGVFQHMSHLQHISIARSDISIACVQQIMRVLPIYTSVDIRGPHRQSLL